MRTIQENIKKERKNALKVTFFNILGIIFLHFWSYMNKKMTQKKLRNLSTGMCSLRVMRGSTPAI